MSHSKPVKTIRFLVKTSIAAFLFFTLLESTASLASTLDKRSDLYGKIAGRVTDGATGQPIPGVNVFLEGTLQGGSTDENGDYTIVRISPGTYTVKASYIGYASQTIANVQVVIDQTTRIDISLSEEIYEGEEVLVTATRGVVQMDRTTTTSVVDASQIAALPVTTIGDAINLQAGVVDGRFRGGRSGEVGYLVNGVPINNAFTNQPAFDVEPNMVSSIQVISGVFNAEYGQAQSGIVNIVTKGVANEWTASALGYIGTIASNRELEFVQRNTGPGLNLSASQFSNEYVSYTEASDFTNNADLQFSFGGPLLKDRIGIQVIGRYLNENGYFIGRDIYSPSDSSTGLTSGRPSDTWSIDATGTGDYVPLGGSERWSLNATLTARVGQSSKLEYNGFFQDGELTPYNHFTKYVPNGTNNGFYGSQTHILSYRYTVGQKSFGNVSYSYLRDKYDSYLYDCSIVGENRTLDCKGDDVYQWSQKSNLNGQNAFVVAGNDLYTSDNLTETHTLLANFSSQIGTIHLVKGGISFRQHSLNNRNYGIERSSRTNNEPRVSPDVFADNTLTTKPLEFAAYIQDKLEFVGLIINAGLRFDYFDADYLIPVDWSQADSEEIIDPNNTTQTISNRKQADVKTQISPRLGIAFPISANGVMRFSAGMFFQTPALNLLYTNPEYEVNPTSSSNQFGNPALEPERTLSFEVGLQQGLTDNMGIEMTLFSKDIRNLTGQEILRLPTGDDAIYWINRDYGTIRGFTLSLFDLPGGTVSWSVDYTLQFAEGTSSDPGEAFGRQQSGLEPVLSIVRLNWDRRHVLNNTITIDAVKNLNLTFVNRLRSGEPYTTVRGFVRSTQPNNGNRPLQFTTDLRAYYTLGFSGRDIQLFLQIRNLFDAEVINTVYASTGRADEALEKELARNTGSVVGGVNSLDEFYYRQEWYGAPRTVSLGISAKL